VQSGDGGVSSLLPLGDASIGIPGMSAIPAIEPSIASSSIVPHA
jgi:hypothetical protein